MLGSIVRLLCLVRGRLMKSSSVVTNPRTSGRSELDAAVNNGFHTCVHRKRVPWEPMREATWRYA
jgi:hypothetical protein